MTVARSIVLFVLAAVAEIGGAWLIWQGVREHKGLAFMAAVWDLEFRVAVSGSCRWRVAVSGSCR